MVSSGSEQHEGDPPQPSQRGQRQSLDWHIYNDRTILAVDGWQDYPRDHLWDLALCTMHVKWCHINRLWARNRHEIQTANNYGEYKSCGSQHFAHRAKQVHYSLWGCDIFKGTQIFYSLAAMVYVELILGRRVSWQTAARPKRKRRRHNNIDIVDTFEGFRYPPGQLPPQPPDTPIRRSGNARPRQRRRTQSPPAPPPAMQNLMGALQSTVATPSSPRLHDHGLQSDVAFGGDQMDEVVVETQMEVDEDDVFRVHVRQNQNMVQDVEEATNPHDQLLEELASRNAYIRELEADLQIQRKRVQELEAENALLQQRACVVNEEGQGVHEGALDVEIQHSIASRDAPTTTVPMLVNSTHHEVEEQRYEEEKKRKGKHLDKGQSSRIAIRSATNVEPEELELRTECETLRACLHRMSAANRLRLHVPRSDLRWQNWCAWAQNLARHEHRLESALVELMRAANLSDTSLESVTNRMHLYNSRRLLRRGDKFKDATYWADIDRMFDNLPRRSNNESVDWMKCVHSGFDITGTRMSSHIDPASRISLMGRIPEWVTDGTVCCVCLNPFGPEGAHVLGTCSHVFHSPCLVSVAMTYSACPLCQVPINKRFYDLFGVEENMPPGFEFDRHTLPLDQGPFGWCNIQHWGKKLNWNPETKEMAIQVGGSIRKIPYNFNTHWPTSEWEITKLIWNIHQSDSRMRGVFATNAGGVWSFTHRRFYFLPDPDLTEWYHKEPMLWQAETFGRSKYLKKMEEAARLWHHGRRVREYTIAQNQPLDRDLEARTEQLRLTCNNVNNMWLQFMEDLLERRTTITNGVPRQIRILMSEAIALARGLPVQPRPQRMLNLH